MLYLLAKSLAMESDMAGNKKSRGCSLFFYEFSNIRYQIRNAIPGFFFLFFLLFSANVVAQDACQALKKMSLPDTTITSAESIGPGPFHPPANAAFRQPPAVNLPSYCRVEAVLHPSPDSHIKMELWLPGKGQ